MKLEMLLDIDAGSFGTKKGFLKRVIFLMVVFSILPE